MIYYLDTSALVKKYVLEAGSAKVTEIWKKAEGIALCRTGYAEATAGLYRKKREGTLIGGAFTRVRKSFRVDWPSLICVDLSNALDHLIERLLSRHPLRGFDAIHLAACLSLKRPLKGNLGFVCADQRLLDAATKEKLAVYDVSRDE